MGNIFTSKNSPRDKIVGLQRADILYLEGTNLYNAAVLNPEYAKECKELLQKDVKYQLSYNMRFHIQFACMLPPSHKTFDIKTGIEKTNRFNTNNNMLIAYIRNPKNRNEYLPILPIFEIIQTILQEMDLTYTVTFDRLIYNYYEWKEDNAMLLINIVHKNPIKYKFADDNIVSKNDPYIAYLL